MPFVRLRTHRSSGLCSRGGSWYRLHGRTAAFCHAHTTESAAGLQGVLNSAARHCAPGSPIATSWKPSASCSWLKAAVVIGADGAGSALAAAAETVAAALKLVCHVVWALLAQGTVTTARCDPGAAVALVQELTSPQDCVSAARHQPLAALRHCRFGACARPHWQIACYSGKNISAILNPETHVAGSSGGGVQGAASHARPARTWRHCW